MLSKIRTNGDKLCIKRFDNGCRDCFRTKKHEKALRERETCAKVLSTAVNVVFNYFYAIYYDATSGERETRAKVLSTAVTPKMNKNLCRKWNFLCYRSSRFYKCD